MRQLYEELGLDDDMGVEEREVTREKHFTVGKGLKAYHCKSHFTNEKAGT